MLIPNAVKDREKNIDKYATELVCVRLLLDWPWHFQKIIFRIMANFIQKMLNAAQCFMSQIYEPQHDACFALTKFILYLFCENFNLFPLRMSKFSIID